MRIYFLILISLIISSCGIYSFTGASIPLEVTTISIKNFPNHAEIVMPSLSASFTEGIKDYFLSQTKLNLIDESGDWELSGAIVGYTDLPSATGATESSLNRLTVTIRVEFKDNINEAKSFERSFSQFVEYEGSKSLSEVEEELVADLNEQLINDIFNKIAVDW